MSRRSEILNIFHDIKANWKQLKAKGDSMPVDYCENGCSEEQLENASRRFAPGLRMEDIVLFFDTSVSGSGKTGIIFTETGFYYSDINTLNRISRRPSVPMPVEYDKLEGVEWNRGEPEFFLRFRGGTVLAGSGSIHTRFIVLMLNGIISSGTACSPEPADGAASGYSTGTNLEDAPQTLVKIAESSEKLAGSVIGAMQEKLEENERFSPPKKENVFSRFSAGIEKAEESLHAAYAGRVPKERRRIIMRCFLIFELILLGATLVLSGDPAGLFGDVYGCTMTGALTDLFLSAARRDLSSFIGYGNFMMAGLSCILMSVMDLELEELRIRRFGYFLHTLLFTYTGGIALLYVWIGMKAAFGSLRGIPVIGTAALAAAAVLSLVLIYLALKDLTANIMETLVSIAVGTVFMMGLGTVIYVLSAPLLMLFSKFISPGSVSSVAGSLRDLAAALTAGDLSDPLVVLSIRLAVFTGYAVTSAFRKAWKDVKEKRERAKKA